MGIYEVCHMSPFRIGCRIDSSLETEWLKKGICQARYPNLTHTQKFGDQMTTIYPPEPFRIKVVEPIRLISREERDTERVIDVHRDGARRIQPTRTRSGQPRSARAALGEHGVVAAEHCRDSTFSADPRPRPALLLRSSLQVDRRRPDHFDSSPCFPLDEFLWGTVAR